MRTDGIGMYVFAVLVVILFAGIITVMVLFPNGFQGSTQQKMIVVRATGTASGYPSEGIVYLTLNGTGQTASIATSNLSLSASKLNYTLLKYTNSSDISTIYYSLSRITNSSTYSATEEFMVTTSESNVSAILGSVASINGISINGASAKLSDSQTSALISKALSAAMANATSQAELLAANSSVTPVNISSSSSYIYPIYYGAAFSTASVSSHAPSFFAGTQSVTEQVTVVFKSS